MADRVTLQADKAELPSKIFLWRECQCHQDTNMGYTHRKSSVITAPKLPGAPVEFFRAGYDGQDCAHVLPQHAGFLQPARCRPQNHACSCSRSTARRGRK